MTFVELVQNAMRESGLTMTSPEPITLTGVTGITLKMKNWVQQAWEELQVENDDAEFRRSWFSTTIAPKFYFDLASNTWQQPSVGDTLTWEFSGTTCTVTNVVIINGGTWAGGTAQGFIEFANLSGVPMLREQIKITNIIGTPYGCRFIEWGDYDLSSPTEMGDSAILDMEDVWWETFRLQSLATASSNSMNEIPIDYVDYAGFMQLYDTGPMSLSLPVFVTQTPQGRVKFFPPIGEGYNLHGHYTLDLIELVDDADTPYVLKQQYHPMIYWRAVWKYGEFEQQPMIASMAKERYGVYKKSFDREMRPPVVFRPAPLY